MTIDPNPSSAEDHGQYSKAPAWSEQMTLIIQIGFGLAVIGLVTVFWPVIPLAFGTIIVAYLLTPLTDFFTNRLAAGRRALGITFTFIFIIIVALTVMIVLLPPLVEQTINGITSVFDAINRLVNEPILVEGDSVFIDPETGDAVPLIDFLRLTAQQQGFETIDAWIVSALGDFQLDTGMVQQLTSIGSDVTSSFVGSIFSIAGTTLGFIISTLFFVTLLASFLAGGRRMVEIILHGLPEGYHDDGVRLMTELGLVWNGYVRGNFILGLIMGALMWVIATLLGLPNPLFLAFVAFAMEFIPTVGPTLTMVIAVIMTAAGGSSVFPEASNLAMAFLVVVIWIMAQNLEAIVLVPRIVGENLKLHPAVVLLAVIWGGSLGGLLGVVIAPPLVASIRIVMQYVYGRLTGRPAFSELDTGQEQRENWFQRMMHMVGGGKRQKAPSEQKNE